MLQKKIIFLGFKSISKPISFRLLSRHPKGALWGGSDWPPPIMKNKIERGGRSKPSLLTLG